MTREQALNRLEEVNLQLHNLQQERADLRKMILGELVPMQRAVPAADRLTRHTSKLARGVSREVVLRAIREIGRSNVTPGELVKHTGLTNKTVYAALNLLHRMNFLHKHTDSVGHTVYELALKPEPGELNHL